MLTMFRLKALEIYMDPINESVADIEMALTKLRCVQIAFCVFCCVNFGFWITIRIGQSTPINVMLWWMKHFASVNAIMAPISATIIFLVHIYIYRMCLTIVDTMQEMQFLRSNLTKYVLFICLLLTFINIFSVVPVSFIVNQIVKDEMGKTEFECSANIKFIAFLIRLSNGLTFPLDCQAVFVGTVALIAKI